VTANRRDNEAAFGLVVRQASMISFVQISLEDIYRSGLLESEMVLGILLIVRMGCECSRMPRYGCCFG
jgi:hypothetical protein